MDRISAMMTIGLLLTLGSVLQFPESDAVQNSGWGMAEIIEDDDVIGGANSAIIDVDPNGNAVSIMILYHGFIYNLWANHYTAGVGWGTAHLIETENSGRVLNFDLSVDPSGNAIAVWSLHDGARYNIWANRYVVGVGWDKAELIETDNTGSADSPDVAVDADGNAVAVWYQSDGTRSNIWSNRFDPDEGWGTAQMIETLNAGDAEDPDVDADPSGDAVAVWQQSDGTRFNIWSNRYVEGIGWGVAQLIETDDAGPAEAAHVAVDDSGNAVAVWKQSDGTRNNVWSNRFHDDYGWGTAQLIENLNTGPVDYTRLVIDPMGNVIAVWRQSDGSRFDIFTNRYESSTGWGGAQLLETDDAGDAYSVNIGVDQSGNAIAVWSQNDGIRSNIYSKRFIPGIGWGSAELVETDNSGSASFPFVAVDPSGNAIAVWRQSDGSKFNIWANRYVMPDTSPPALYISTPSEGAIAELPVLTVSGTTEPGVDLVVNGLLVSVAKNGSFSCDIHLKDGQNEILITATDASGNPTGVMRNVTYDDPLPEMMDRIDSLEDSFESAMEDMASMEDRIAAVETDLMVSDENMSSLKGSLSELRADLNSTLANLTSIQEALVSLEDDLNGSGYDIDEIEDALSELRDDINDTGDELEDLQGRLDLLNGQVDEGVGFVQEENDDLRSDLDEMRTLTTVLIVAVVALILFSFFLLIISVVALARKGGSGPRSSVKGSEE